MSNSVRNDFPAIAKTSHIYLDNAATTHKPLVVIDAESDFYREFNANPYRSQHTAGRRVTELYETCRSMVAHCIGADADEVIFTRNTTEGINLLAYTWGLNELKPGDHIVLPVYEHHSNLVPWQMVCKKTGAELHYLYPNENGAISSEEIDRVITAQTKLISCAHISNVLACSSPLDALVAAGKAVGARVFLDCAQSVAHMPLNLHELAVDAAAFSGHKIYGPMGIGVLYIRRELMATLEPFFYGGEMIDQVAGQNATYQVGPRRFEAGTPNVAAAFALANALDYIQNIGWDYIQTTEATLTKQLLDGLQLIKGIKILGSTTSSERAGSLISFTNTLLNTEDIAMELNAVGVAVRGGTHCAQPLHTYMKLTSSLRISPCFYNTSEEIELCLKYIEEMPRRITRRLVSSLP